MTDASEFQPAIDHLNHDHADTIVFIGRMLGGPSSATKAQLSAVDATGLSILLDDAETIRLDFADPQNNPGNVRSELLALLAEARSKASDEEPLTSIELEFAANKIPTRMGEVVSTGQVTPGMRRITIASEALSDYTPAGPDDFIFVLVPPRGRTELSIDVNFSWQEIETMSDEEKPGGAYYTVREYRKTQMGGEIDFWFLLHGDEGTGSAWASVAQPGDPVVLWGPRTSLNMTADTSHVLLAADETGMPAMLNILEQLAPGIEATALAEVADAAERDALCSQAGDVTKQITWFLRTDRSEPATSLLTQAVKDLDPLPENAYAWGGAESRIMTAIRKHLRNERDFELANVDMIAYWRSDLG